MMTPLRLPPRRAIVAVAIAAIAATGGIRAVAAARQAAPAGVTAAEAVRSAFVDRLGAGAEVVVLAIDGFDPAAPVRSARPDPSGKLGQPVRVTMLPISGQAVIATATVRVIADRVVARRSLPRGATVRVDDVALVRAELEGTPIRALPTLAQVTGARVLRPIAEGAIVLPGTVAVPRAIEPGDTVTVVAAIGAVEVTATFVAADGGGLGDLIRVMNPDTRRYVRGRIVKPGLVEVIYEK